MWTAAQLGAVWIRVSGNCAIVLLTCVLSQTCVLQGAFWAGSGYLIAIKLGGQAEFCPGETSAVADFVTLCTRDLDYCRSSCCTATPSGRRCIYCGCAVSSNAYGPYCAALHNSNNQRQFCQAAARARRNDNGAVPCITERVGDFLDAVECGELCIYPSACADSLSYA